MRTYLESNEAAFYHITTEDRLEDIRARGLDGDDLGRIFVARIADIGAWCSIAATQLIEDITPDYPRFIVWKLSQSLNNFQTNEISLDYQANEPTMPFHNIIYRNNIPYNNIELINDMVELDLNEINRRGMLYDDYLFRNPIDDNIFNLIYERSKPSFRLTRGGQIETIN